MPTRHHPSYLFLGEEDFLKEEAIEKLKKTCLDSRTIDLNYGVFSAKGNDFEIKEVFDALNTLPFLSKRRLVILKNADSLSAQEKDAVLSYLRDPRKSSIFVIESASPVIKGGFLLEASKLAQLVYYRRLTDSSLNTWLVKKAALFDKKISSEAISAVKESLPNDLRILSSGMDNLILYTGKRPLITGQDVEKVIGLSPTHTAFDLMNSIERKDVKKALHIFSALKRDKKRETELLGLLGWNARMLLRVKYLLRIKSKTEMCRDLGLNPRMFDHIMRRASKFEKSQILSLLDEIVAADFDIKTGMAPTAVIERLIVKMCS